AGVQQGEAQSVRPELMRARRRCMLQQVGQQVGQAGQSWPAEPSSTRFWPALLGAGQPSPVLKQLLPSSGTDSVLVDDLPEPLRQEE
ncbi:unnamed protein product, partial [Closterium sp. NIES-64]